MPYVDQSCGCNNAVPQRMMDSPGSCSLAAPQAVAPACNPAPLYCANGHPDYMLVRYAYGN